MTTKSLTNTLQESGLQLAALLDHALPLVGSLNGCEDQDAKTVLIALLQRATLIAEALADIDNPLRLGAVLRLQTADD